MPNRVLDFLDVRLYRLGFSHGEARRMLRAQLAVAAVSSVMALVWAWGKPWGWSFVAGAVLATANFWWLARFGQHALASTGALVGRTVFWFYTRLAGTTVVLYVLIVEAEAPVWAVLAGVSTVLATLLSWGVLKGAGSNRAKEA